MSNETEDARFFNPPNYLKQKVGSGGLPKGIIEKAQQLIDSNDIDFSPYAKQFLAHIDVTIGRAISSEFRTHDHVVSMIFPVMQLKAHGGMFGYPLVSEISANILHFLENIHVLDNDAIDIVKAHYNTLTAIATNQVHGLGGDAGYELVTELADVCERYYKKHDITPE